MQYRTIAGMAVIGIVSVMLNPAYSKPDKTLQLDRIVNIGTVIFSPKNDLCAVSFSGSEGVLILELPSHRVRAKLPDRFFERAAAFSPCGKYFATGGFPWEETDTVSVWAIDKDKPVLVKKMIPSPRFPPNPERKEPGTAITDLSFSSDGTRIVTLQERLGGWTIWDISKLNPTEKRIRGFPVESRRVRFLGGDYFWTNEETRMRMWKVTANETTSEKTIDYRYWSCQYVTADLKTMVRWNSDSALVEVCDVQAPEPKVLFNTAAFQREVPRFVVITPDRSLLIGLTDRASENPGKIIICPFGEKKRKSLGLKESESHFEISPKKKLGPGELRLSSDGRWLALEGTEQRLRIWDVQDLANTLLKDAQRIPLVEKK